MTQEEIPAGRPDPSRRGAVVAGDVLLSVVQVAELVGVLPGTWRSWVSRGRAPVADEGGRWLLSTVRAWQRLRPGRGQRSSPVTSAGVLALARQWGCTADEAIARVHRDVDPG